MESSLYSKENFIKKAKLALELLEKNEQHPSMKYIFTLLGEYCAGREGSIKALECINAEKQIAWERGYEDFKNKS